MTDIMKTFGSRVFNDSVMRERLSAPTYIELNKTIKNGEYLMCGDNRYGLGRGITDRHIIGVLTAIIRNGRTLPVQPPEPRLWYRSMLYRRLVFKLRKQR